MTRKHYQAIADAIGGAFEGAEGHYWDEVPGGPDYCRFCGSDAQEAGQPCPGAVEVDRLERVVSSLSAVFAADNERYDRDRFRAAVFAAAGLDPEEVGV